MASLFLIAQNYSAAASKAQTYGTVAAVVSVVLVVGSHLILNRWKPDNRLQYAVRMALRVPATFAWWIGPPIAANLMDISLRHHQDNINGFLGATIFLSPVLFAIGWAMGKSKFADNPADSSNN